MNAVTNITNIIDFNSAVDAVSPIDELAQLDKQVKALTERCKQLKDDIANEYGEGKHRGAVFGVRVTIEQRKGSVDMKALCAHFGISDEQVEQFRGDPLAIIKVSPTA